MYGWGNYERRQLETSVEARGYVERGLGCGVPEFDACLNAPVQNVLCGIWLQLCDGVRRQTS